MENNRAQQQLDDGPFERAMQAQRPLASRLDRDELLFQAGRRDALNSATPAIRTSSLWKVTTGISTAAAIALGLLSARQYLSPPDRLISRPSTTVATPRHAESGDEQVAKAPEDQEEQIPPSTRSETASSPSPFTYPRDLPRSARWSDLVSWQSLDPLDQLPMTSAGGAPSQSAPTILARGIVARGPRNSSLTID